MIERLKPSWKVLTASVGLVGLGVVGAPTALAQPPMFAQAMVASDGLTQVVNIGQAATDPAHPRLEEVRDHLRERFPHLKFEPSARSDDGRLTVLAGDTGRMVWFPTSSGHVGEDEVGLAKTWTPADKGSTVSWDHIRFASDR